MTLSHLALRKAYPTIARMLGCSDRALQSAAEIRTQPRSVEARQASRFTLSLFRFGGDI